MDKAFLLKAVPLSSPIANRYVQPTPVSQTGGGGAFSAVFRAIDSVTGEAVALKFLATQDGYRKLAFDREAGLATGVLRGEPLFVQSVAGAEELRISVTAPQGQVDLSLPFIAFEWMAKGSAETLCRPPATPGAVARQLRWFSEMIRCVSRAHLLGIDHRDYKPGNFLLGPGSMVKLCDFGTAKLLAPGTPSILLSYNAPPGDLRYTAPETLAGLTLAPTTARLADTYSLGVILFEMLTGHPMFPHTLKSVSDLKAFVATWRGVTEQKRTALFTQYIEGVQWSIPAVRAINPAIPRCVHWLLDNLIAQLTHPDFRQRPISMESIHRRLDICRYHIDQERRRATRKMRQIRSRPKPQQFAIGVANA